MSRPSLRSSLRFAALALLALGAAACAGRPERTQTPWSTARQMIVVTVPDWDATTGTLRTYERGGEGWREVEAAVPVTIGRSGAAWGLGLHPAQRGGPIKREGDGRAPAGVFAIGQAFGYAASADTALPYAPMRDSHWCIDVPASPLYNRIVDAAEVGTSAVAGSTEPMRRDLHKAGDPRYRLGFVIEHNTQARPGAGSCIFAHLWQAPGEATAGCTAMAEPAMQRLVRWLRPQAQPVFVLLPQAEYARLRSTWQLPGLAAP